MKARNLYLRLKRTANIMRVLAIVFFIGGVIANIEIIDAYFGTQVRWIPTYLGYAVQHFTPALIAFTASIIIDAQATIVGEVHAIRVRLIATAIEKRKAEQEPEELELRGVFSRPTSSKPRPDLFAPEAPSPENEVVEPQRPRVYAFPKLVPRLLARKVEVNLDDEKPEEIPEETREITLRLNEKGRWVVGYKRDKPHSFDDD